MLSDWDPSAWPLKENLGALRNFQDRRSAVVVAVEFIRSIMTKSIRRPSDSVIIMALFAALADGKVGVEAIAVVERNLDKIFGLNVTAARELHDIIEQWKGLRGM